MQSIFCFLQLKIWDNAQCRLFPQSIAATKCNWTMWLSPGKATWQLTFFVLLVLNTTHFTANTKTKTKKNTWKLILFVDPIFGILHCTFSLKFVNMH